MTGTTRTFGATALALAFAWSAGAFAQTDDPASEQGGAQTSAQDIDFGDDTSTWANDGQCDDPRFTGAGAAAFTLEDDAMADATDCRAAYEAGAVSLARETGETAQVDGIDFGDNSSTWANDGECDDGRFTGEGMGLTSMNHVMRDAADCRAAYEAGTITLADTDTGPAPDQTETDAAINFGDDSGTWANDNACDDPRFTGVGVGVALEDHRLADATDCRTAYEAGTVTLIENAEEADYPIIIDGIDFGDDSGSWSQDGECDDARFEGTGMGVQSQNHVMADATDCSAAYQAGTITPVTQAELAEPVINFGDDSSALSNDGTCDDPRFQGQGGASLLYPENMMADATDCQTAYDAGTVDFAPQ